MEVQENTIDIIREREIIIKDYDQTVTASNASLVIKRAFDIVFSSCIMLLVFPWLFPVICLLVGLTSKGGVFFVQRRNGMHNKVFRCFKFRTMVVNAEADSRAAGENDRRITKIGNFLRISGIDELPQLINVLIGDMSIVGPRPHMINDNLRFEKIAEHYNERNLVKPGITGLAQVKGYKGNAEDAQSIKMRTIMDLKYVRNRNLKLDIKIIVATVKMMFVEVCKIGRGK